MKPEPSRPILSHQLDLLPKRAIGLLRLVVDRRGEFPSASTLVDFSDLTNSNMEGTDAGVLRGHADELHRHF